MATIRVRDWTKARIEEILEAESHSSHDSVIKSLLKDRELAQYAGRTAPEEAATEQPPESPETAFEDLTVLSELVTADNGLLFLWCPNCGSEMAHLGVENPVSISVYEAECQRCLTRLDQHAIVAIEIGYPIEERLVDGTLESDLQACVVDYWDRALERYAAGELELDMSDEQFVWTLGEYYREFGWAWPEEVPVPALEVGRTYRDEATGERLAVEAVATENRGAPDDYRVRRDEASETEVLASRTVTNLVLNRNLTLVA